MIRTTVLAAGLLLAAGAANAQSSMSGGSSMNMSAAAMSTPDYLTAAGQSDQFEIQEGRLAEQKGSSARVKAFGRQMVADHTKSTQMVMAAAQTSGMTPSTPPLRPDQQQMLSQLQGTSGADFDRTYIQQQTQSHQEALMVQQGYAQGGTDRNLKAAAAKIVPVVQHHLQELQSMGGGM